MRNSHRETFPKRRWDEIIRIPRTGIATTEELIRKIGPPMEEGVYSDSKGKHLARIAKYVEDIRGTRWGKLSPEAEVSHDLDALFSLVLPLDIQAAMCLPPELNRIIRIGASEGDFLTNFGMITPASILDVLMFTQNQEVSLVHSREYHDYIAFIMAGVLRKLGYDTRIGFKQKELKDGVDTFNDGIVPCAIMIEPDDTNRIIIAGPGRRGFEYDSVFVPDEASIIGVAALLTAANSIRKYMNVKPDDHIARFEITKEIVENLTCAHAEIHDGETIIADFLEPLFDILDRRLGSGILDTLSRSEVVRRIIELGEERRMNIDDKNSDGEVRPREAVN